MREGDEMSVMRGEGTCASEPASAAGSKEYDGDIPGDDDDNDDGNDDGNDDDDDDDDDDEVGFSEEIPDTDRARSLYYYCYINDRARMLGSSESYAKYLMISSLATCAHLGPHNMVAFFEG